MIVIAIDTNMTATAGAADGTSALRRAANELVGEVFYGTLLRQLRDSSLKGEYGHGGRGEEIFRGQLDGVLATRAGAAGDNTLADALVKRFEHRAEAVAAYRRELRARTQDFATQAAAMKPAVGEIDA